MVARLGFPVAGSFFNFSLRLLQRSFSVSSHTFKEGLSKQEATISPKLKEILVAQLREAKKQEKPHLLGCNCLPLKGTPEFDKMAKDFIQRVT